MILVVGVCVVVLLAVVAWPAPSPLRAGGRATRGKHLVYARWWSTRRRRSPDAASWWAERLRHIALLLESGTTSRDAWVIALASTHDDPHEMLSAAPDAARVAHRLMARGTEPREALATTHDPLALRLAWVCEVVEASGAPAARVLRNAAATLDAEADVAAERHIGSAQAHATIKTLLLLPALGWGMGYALGGNPFRVLFTDPVGHVALAAGLGATTATTWWVRRVLRSVPDEERVAVGWGLDLAAAVLSAGAPPAAALRTLAQGRCAPEAVADAARRLAHVHELGVPWLAAGRLVDASGFAAAITMAFGVAERTGAPAASVLASQARDARRSAHAAARKEAAALGTRLVLPLGLCGLPAFALLVVVPTVLGILRGIAVL